MEIYYSSSAISELIKAEVQARKAYKSIEPDTKGNFGPYTTLDAIKASTEDALLENGLIFRQNRILINDKFYLETSLSHISGQWRRSLAPLPVAENSRDLNQAHGGAVSYQRRYEAYGFLGLGKGDDNDDPDIKKPDDKTEEKPTSHSGTINDNQLRLLKARTRGNVELEKNILLQYKIETLAQLPWKKLNECLKFFGLEGNNG